MLASVTSAYAIRMYRKHNYNGSDSSWKTIPYNAMLYAGHITSTFVYENILFQVTQLHITENLHYYCKKDVSLQHFERDDRAKLGFNLKAQCRLVYTLCDSLQMGFHEALPFGGCMLTCGRASFKTNFHIEVTETYVLDGFEANKSYKVSQNPPSFSIHARYVPPKWFTQSKTDRIVLPGSSITDLFHLSIVQQPGNDPISSITSMEVKLLHILEGLNSRTHVETTTLFVSDCILNIESCRTNLSNGKTIVVLPKISYGGRIPQVGPTFFARNTTRKYCLEFKVFFKDSKNTEYFRRTYVSVNMASVEQRLSNRLTHERGEELTPRVRREKDESIVLFHMESKSLENFRQENVARAIFKRLKKQKMTYECHDTIGFRCCDSIITITKVKCGNPQELKGKQVADWLNKTKAEIDKHRFGSSLDETGVSEALVYRALHLHNPNHGSPLLFVGPFLSSTKALSEPFMRKSPPAAMPAMLVSEVWNPVKVRSVSVKREVAKLGLTFEMCFKRPVGIVQREEDVIVTQGMWFKDFLELRLVVDQATTSERGITSIVARRIEVHLVEKTLAFTHAKNMSPMVPCEISKVKCIYDEELRTKLELDCALKGTSTFDFSSFLSSAELPEVGPTYFSNSRSRTYYVKVLVWVSPNEDPERVAVELTQQVNLATLPIEQANSDSTPPKFMDLHWIFWGSIRREIY